MIVEIEGILTKLEPGMAVIKLNNGISYGIIISLNCSATLIKGEETALLIKQIVREDANLLYGFKDSDEKMMFEVLLKVSGVGASTAMAVCSTLKYCDFASAVINGDTKVLTTVPGIGLKTARKIIAELSDAKLISSQNLESYKSESIMALESLGFKRDKILKILPTCKAQNTADLIKEALKKLA
ncbi:Holliday junction DNA helicase RuvA [Campylobacter ureolyticus ACS-301-V-Sch3b]|uniref:Holliday junction branch migration complex subunit RuvA n=1 Tax=Campylobacter ureolyticus ACS-301-V-Sch3b TaxID=883165 RepID=S3XD28_9BACT|nr:Holliday junction branch migration protein RuvA [Campylobacter ureolyticus]EPH07986.1 Holliday junction DNA helicase RuvA [Campylobacter ureolyticus ACS-301-V-Sch3b]